MRNLAFEKNVDQQPSPILNAIQHYQTKLGDIGKEAPTDFLDTKLREKLWSQSGKFKTSLYKALLFIHIAESLKSGAISLSPAYRYLSLENYLHPKAHWLANKERLLEETGLMRFADVDELLNGYRRKLHEAFLMTNNRILEGQNDFIKFKRDGKMVLTTPRVDKIDTKPVSALFDDKKHVSLLEILNEIQRVTNYLDCFTHYSVKSKKVQPKPTNFYAAIMGLAT